MKRFHVHLHVDDLPQSIAFYSKLFAAEPARVEGDYAKWMLDDPAVNFAISTRGSQPGLDHLGIQTDNAEELAGLKARAEAADLALLQQLLELAVGQVDDAAPGNPALDQHHRDDRDEEVAEIELAGTELRGLGRHRLLGCLSLARPLGGHWQQREGRREGRRKK